MELQELDIEKLFVDQYNESEDVGYQRQIRPKMVKKIVTNYNPDLDKPIDVSMRSDGRFAIVDGQHRWAAKKQLGHKVIKAWVYTGRDRAWEAGFFADNQSERTQMRPLERFRAQLQAGRTRAIEINQVVLKYDLKITDHKHQERVISAVGTIEQIYDKYGLQTLDDALRIITSAWSNELQEGLKNYYIAGLAVFMNRHKDNPVFSESRLVQRLTEVGPYPVQQRALASATINQYGGGGRNEHVARGFESIYNHKLHKNRLGETEA